MIIILFAQVIARYFFDFPVMWSEEIGRYMYIWVVYLGSSLAFINKKHLIVDILVDKLNGSLKIKLFFIIYVSILFFLTFVLIYGFQYVKINWHHPTYTIKFIKLGWAYASIPVGSFFMIINIIRLLPEIVKKIKT